MRLQLLLSSLVGLAGCVPVSTPLGPDQEAKRALELVRLLEQSTAGMRQGDDSGLDMAQASLNLADELSPEDPRVQDGFGCVAFRRGEIRQAEEHFRKAIELAPHYDRAYAHLALVAEADGNLTAAYDLLKLAVMMNPMNFRARNNLSALLHDAKSHDGSYRELLKAYQTIRQDDPVIDYNLGIAPHRDKQS